MATEVISTIRASGGDYTTLSAWEAALPANLVSADEQHTAVCYNDWPSGLDETVTIAGQITDATRYIRVTVAAGHRHDGSSETGFYLKNSPATTTTPVLLSTVSYTIIDSVEVQNTRGDGFYAIATNATNCTVKNAIAKAGAGRGFSGIFGTTYATTRVRLINCLAIDSHQGFGRHDSTRSRYNAYNCAAVNCEIGFASGSTNKAAIQNCVAYGSTTIDFENQVDATNSDYNASSDSSASVFTGGVTGIDSSDFVDASGGDFHLASGSALIGVGSNLYSLFTDDVDGDIRPSSGAWDIGFDHYVSAGATGTISSTESGPDVAAVSGVVLVSGTISATESGADTAGVTGDVYVSGALSSSESGPDVASIIGGLVTPAITGTISAAEAGSDAASISGDVLVRGSISAAEAGADTASLSGDTIVSGALSASETGSDTAFINGSSAIISTGALSTSEVGADGCTVTGKVYLSGELSAIEGALDGFAASGNIYVSGALAASESGADSAAIAGTSLILTTGVLTASETGSDGCAVTGKVYLAGELSAVETGLDGFAVSGNIHVTGVLSALESGSDTAYIYETPIRPRRPLPDIFVKSEQQRAFVHSRRLDIWVKSPSDSVRIK